MIAQGTFGVDDIQVHTKGLVSDGDRDRARGLLAEALPLAPRPVLAARLELDVEPNPARERPAKVKAMVDVSGRIVRTHVARPTMDAAVDDALQRIRRGLARLSEERETRRRRGATSGPGEWRHGDLPESRPEYFPRPPEDRQVVRQKTYALGVMTPEEALFEMELLGFDFHLYRDEGTGTDCVITLDEQGDPLLIAGDPDVGRGPAGEPREVGFEAAPTISLSTARGLLEGAGAPYVAFIDASTGRENVIYHRYDGHYGLLGPTIESEEHRAAIT